MVVVKDTLPAYKLLHDCAPPHSGKSRKQRVPEAQLIKPPQPQRSNAFNDITIRVSTIMRARKSRCDSALLLRAPCIAEATAHFK